MQYQGRNKYYMSKTVIFDLDGTLAYTAIDIRECFKKAFEIVGVNDNAFNWESLPIGPSLDELIALIASDLGDEIKTLIKREFSNLYDNSAYPMTNLTPGCKELLDWLKENNYKCFVATSKRNTPTKRILEKFLLSSYFCSVICTDSQMPLKKLSKKEMVENLVSVNNIDRLNCWMIGDTKSDCEAARVASIKGILVLNGYGSSEEHLNTPTDYVVDSLIDCKLIFERGK
jgi:phosphoglycolate phosphatase-like HAD superfamily hydrolase